MNPAERAFRDVKCGIYYAEVTDLGVQKCNHCSPMESDTEPLVLLGDLIVVISG